jgi:hypothetical protein
LLEHVVEHRYALADQLDPQPDHRVLHRVESGAKPVEGVDASPDGFHRRGRDAQVLGKIVDHRIYLAEELHADAGKRPPGIVPQGHLLADGIGS